MILTSNTLRKNKKGKIELPKASNELVSSDLFKQRKYYKDNILVRNIRTIDLWEENKYYGLLDKEGNSIKLKEEYLVNIDKIQVLNFVADAFKEFQSSMERASNNKTFDKKSIFTNITPKVGWIGLDATYENYFTGVFKKPLFDSVDDKKIVTFNDYVKELLKSFMLNGKMLPITQSLFLTSNMFFQRTNGLIIEIGEGTYDDDNAKYNKYIKDNMFSFYKNEAQRFGFAVDKNVPWRLVAQLNSPKMQRYMDTYEITLDNIFEVYYNIVYRDELTTLQKMIEESYKDFLREKGDFIIEERTCCQRQREVGVVSRKYNDDYWFNTYLDIKFIEAQNDYSDKEKKKIKSKALTLKKHVDIQRSLWYINTEIT